MNPLLATSSFIYFMQKMMSFVAFPQQETNMFEFQMLRAYRDIVIKIPVLLHFLEYHKCLPLGIRPLWDLSVVIQKYGDTHSKNSLFYDHKTFNGARSNPSRGGRTHFLRQRGCE